MRVLLALAAMAALSGCQFGPAFVPLEPHPDRAVVYIYFAQQFGNQPYGYTVHADNKPVAFLREGGYLGYFAEARETEFWAKTEATSSITLDLEPGETYYLKGDLTFGVWSQRPRLTLVDHALGASEIKECWQLYFLTPSLSRSISGRTTP